MVGEALGRTRARRRGRGRDRARRSTTPPRSTRRSSGKTFIFACARHDRPVEDRLLHAGRQPAAAARRPRHGQRADRREAQRAGAVLRHRLRRAGRRPGVRRASHVRREPTTTWRRSPTTRCSARSRPSRAGTRTPRPTRPIAPRGHAPVARCRSRTRWSTSCRRSPRRSTAAADALLTVPETASGRPPPAGRTRTSGRGAMLVAAVLVASVLSVLVGSTTISPTRRLRQQPTRTTRSPWPALARTCLALAVGAALGLAGACMQGLTRNPLADPGILGDQRRRLVRDGAGDLGVRASPTCRRTSGSRSPGRRVTMVARARDRGARPRRRDPGEAGDHRRRDHGGADAAGRPAVLLIDRATMESFRFWQVGTVGGRGFEVLLTGLPFLVVGARAGAGAASGCSTRSRSATTWPAASAGTSARDRLVLGLAVRPARRRRHRAGRPDRVRRA